MDIQRRPGGIVLEGIWRVLACPMKMLRIEMNGDGVSGELANPGLPGK